MGRSDETRLYLTNKSCARVTPGLQRVAYSPTEQCRTRSGLDLGLDISGLTRRTKAQFCEMLGREARRRRQGAVYQAAAAPSRS